VLQGFPAMARPGLEPGKPRFSETRRKAEPPIKDLQSRRFSLGARVGNAVGLPGLARVWDSMTASESQVSKAIANRLGPASEEIAPVLPDHARARRSPRGAPSWATRVEASATLGSQTPPAPQWRLGTGACPVPNHADSGRNFAAIEFAAARVSIPRYGSLSATGSAPSSFFTPGRSLIRASRA
jgi:hypothetical protein